MEIIGKTNIGIVRFTNEDSFVINKKDDNNFVAFVCDGMGGHLGGSFASNKTSEIINNNFLENNIKDPSEWLREIIEKANEEVFEKSRNDANLRGMGTTVTGIIKINDDIYYAHIGDSRLYVFNKDSILQVTSDHTYVNTLLLNGVITKKQALKHPQRHVLTNALGIKKEVSVDIGKVNLKADEGLLICSDGLYNDVEEKAILKILNASSKTLDKISDSLIQKAISNGGNDNITVIIVK